MSRCFPYPPPGYSRNGATYEALIESIKLQKETDKAKAERKKEKKARKEKKMEKQRRKDEEKAKAQKNPNDFAYKVAQVKEAHDNKTSTEQLEKSDLTEEHGKPLSLHKPSYSSDSTQNSNKRKREDDAGGTNGKPIKIRLLKKHKGPEKLSAPGSTNPTVPPVANPNYQLKNDDVEGLHSSRNQPAASSGRPILPMSHSNTTKTELPSVAQKTILGSWNSNKTKPSAPPLAPPRPTRLEKKMRKKHDKYEKLIGSWVPPVFEAQAVPDDEDWLVLRSEKTCRASRDDVERCWEAAACSGWRPCARFLAEADVYALPYTVPF